MKQPRARDTKEFFSFVLPAYNEEKNVLPLMEKITAAMSSIGKPYEILFVIEGQDQTYPLLQEYQQKHPEIQLKLLYQPTPLGLMNAFKKGFVNISEQASHVITMDVDLNHDPQELPRLMEKSQAGYNIVIGSRALSESRVLAVPAWKRAVSKIANGVFNTVFKVGVKDKTSGFRIIDAQTIKEITPKLKTRNFEGLMEFLLLARKMNKTMAEVPITLTYRQYGETKFKLLHSGKDYAKLLIGIHFRKL